MTPDKTPSEAELLPCPFCGEAAKHSFNSLYGDMSMASCKSCGATAYAPKWNRRAVLAKWGTPATGGEPAGTVGYTVHGTQYVNWRTKPPAHGTPLYTTPQPTQPVAREQLTDGQIQDLLLCGDPTDEEMRLIRIGWDAAHGIKGGQHGTE